MPSCFFFACRYRTISPVHTLFVGSFCEKAQFIT